MCTPVGVGPRGVKDPGRIRRSRRIRIVWRGDGLLRLVSRIRHDPAPADAGLERAAENVVDLADRPALERPADVRPAQAVAIMLSRDAVLDTFSATAVVPTSTQLGVERVEHVSVDRGGLLRADEWLDVQVDAFDIPLPRAVLKLR